MEKIAGFNWDNGNSEKCQKHGVSIEEIEALFFNQKVRVSPDPNHSEKETRFFAIGMSIKDRPIFVVFTFREIQEERLIRPISARYMHEKEVQKYEENFAKNDE